MKDNDIWTIQGSNTGNNTEKTKKPFRWKNKKYREDHPEYFKEYNKEYRKTILNTFNNMMERRKNKSNVNAGKLLQEEV